MRYLVSLAFLAAVALLAQSPRSQPATGPKIPLTLVAVDDKTSAPIPLARFVLTDDTMPVGDLFEGVFEEMGTHVPVPKANGNGRSTVLVAPRSRMRVFASASGYPIGPTTEIQVAESPLTISLPLTRGVVINGRIVDRDSRQPMEGVSLAAKEVTFYRGTREISSGKWAKTDHDGNFQISELHPGAYIVEAQFPTHESSTGYGVTYWPGGVGLEKAAPTNLKSGQALDLGMILLQKTALRTASVRVSGDCEGYLYNLSLFTDFGDNRLGRAGALHVHCGDTVALNGILPGSYLVDAQPDSMTCRCPQDTAWPTRPFPQRLW